MTHPKERTLFVNNNGGRTSAWLFPVEGEHGIIDIAHKRPITGKSYDRLAQLTFHNDTYDINVVSIRDSHVLLAISRRAPEAVVQAPSPKELPQGVCNTFVSDDECLNLAVSLGQVRRDKGFTIEEVLKIVRWAEDIKLQDSLLEAVLAGVVLVDVRPDGELVFLAGEDPDGIH